MNTEKPHMSVEGMQANPSVEKSESASEKTGRQTLELFAKMAKAANEPDREAMRQEVIELNKPLVKWVANKFARSRQLQSLDVEDLIGAGYRGLITAVDRFDINRGVMFSTYATWWIRQTIMSEIRDTDRMIDMPVYAQDELNQSQKNGGAEKDSHSAELEEINNQTRQPLSLDQPVGNDSDATLGDFIEGKDVPIVDIAVGNVDRKQVEALLREELSQSPGYFEALRLYLGFDESVGPLSYREIGQKLGIETEIAQRRIERAIRLLKSTRFRRRLSKLSLLDDSQ